MKKIFKISAIVLVIAMLAAFCSCGGGKDSESKGVKVIDIQLTDESYAFGVSKTDAELQKAVNDFIAEIKSNGQLDEILNHYFGDGEPVGVTSAVEDSSKDQLVVVTNAEFAPFESLEGDTYYGIDMEMVKLFAEKLGKELVIKNVDFKAVCTTVDSGYADLAAAGLTVSDDRTKFVTFSESYYKASQVLVVKDSDTAFADVKTAEDVENVLKTFDESKKFGFQTGTTGGSYVEGSEDMGFEGFNVTATGYSSAALAVQDMINGNLDYVVVDEAPAKMIVESFNAQNK